MSEINSIQIYKFFNYPSQKILNCTNIYFPNIRQWNCLSVYNKFRLIII